MTTFDGDTPSGETVDVIGDERRRDERRPALPTRPPGPTTPTSTAVSDAAAECRRSPAEADERPLPMKHPTERSTARPKKRIRPSRSRRSCASSRASGTSSTPTPATRTR